MSEEKVYYEYWNGRNTPDKLPDGCERYKGEDEWATLNLPPEDWAYSRYRWPVPEHIWRTNRFCEAYGVSVPDGYELINWLPEDQVEDGLFVIGSDGRVCKPDNSQIQLPVLSKIYEWVTPTDENAKLRPMCEFSENESFKQSYVLPLFGVADCLNLKYISQNGNYKYCRVKKSEIERLRKEKGGE